MKLCEYVGCLSKLLAEEGLSWYYSCSTESCPGGITLLGEGNFIAYYNGFASEQNAHARFFFSVEDNGTDEITFVWMYGVQGTGEHYVPPSIDSPTERELRKCVRTVASWLRTKRTFYK